MPIKQSESPGEKGLHTFFELGVILKGIDGILELAGGFALLFISPAAINAVALFFLSGEIKEDPHDIIANFILRAAGGLIATQTFASVILIVHGAVKLFLVAGLVRGKLWAYPLAIIAFSLFTLYQAYELILGYSLFLFVLTIIDAAVVFLIAHEYRRVRKSKA